MASSFIRSIHLFTDGGCRPNPGTGSIGILLLDQDNQEVESYSDCIGESTNNQAEYHALIKGLDLAAKYCRYTVYCCLDSDIVIKQLNSIYRLKDDKLRKLWHQVRDKERPFEKVIYIHADQSNPNMKRAHNMARQALSGK